MKMLTFSGDSGNEITEADIPKDIEDDAIVWRSQLLDDLSAYSDTLIELLLVARADGKCWIAQEFRTCFMPPKRVEYKPV